MDKHKQKTLREFDMLPEFVRLHYWHRILDDDILRIDRGVDLTGRIEWIDVILVNGIRDHWSRRGTENEWDCQSLKVHKAQEPLAPIVRRTEAIGRTPKEMKCKLCGVAQTKNGFSRLLYANGALRAAICIWHGSSKEVLDKAWSTKRAPRQAEVKVGKRQINEFVKRFAVG